VDTDTSRERCPQNPQDRWSIPSQDPQVPQNMSVMFITLPSARILPDSAPSDRNQQHRP
jgi:hypothetical protein